MARAKIAITIDQETLLKVDGLVSTAVFKNRSQMIQEAVIDKIMKIEKTRLARELSKIDIHEEQKLAEEGMEGELSQWPEY